MENFPSYHPYIWKNFPPIAIFSPKSGKSSLEFSTKKFSLSSPLSANPEKQSDIKPILLIKNNNVQQKNRPNEGPKGPGGRILNSFRNHRITGENLAFEVGVIISLLCQKRKDETVNFFKPCQGGCGRWVRKAGISITSELCPECQEKMREEFFRSRRCKGKSGPEFGSRIRVPSTP